MRVWPIRCIGLRAGDELDALCLVLVTEHSEGELVADISSCADVAKDFYFPATRIVFWLYGFPCVV